MTSSDPLVRIGTRLETRTVRLWSYLDSATAEAVDRDANAWIKSLRHARVDGDPFRSRFFWRGDSLWWFAELYLHKRRTVMQAMRAMRAVEALIARERPEWIGFGSTSAELAVVAPQVCTRLGVRLRGARAASWRLTRDRLRQQAASRLYAFEADARRWRRQRPPRRPRFTPSPGIGGVLAFVHAAFWREQGDEAGLGGQEGYVGPVLEALAARLPPDKLQLVGVGPATAFRGRRWRDRLAEFGGEFPAASLTPVAALVSPSDIEPSLQWWRDRRAVERALRKSDDLRRAAVVDGCDLWRLVEADFIGIATLQFPWSTRAMDEAGAVLDRVAPQVVLTYAEAGGWGRALVLEARRRGIPSVGLQHGFIYRHWLNYLHEPDELKPAESNPSDIGFPRPDLTLVYDEHAAGHLRRAGHFPTGSVVVTGSPRLDALVAAARRLGLDDLEAVRARVGARGGHLALVASKFTQIGSLLPSLLAAVEATPGVCLVIKCHPAETPAPYLRLVKDRPRVTIAPPGSDLASLTAAARVVITVNSTVAIDAMVLGVPSLVLGLPNNLSPFVDEGAMAGAAGDGIADQLGALLYDEGRRAALTRAGAACMARYAIRSDGQAAARSADAILALFGSVQVE